MNIEEIRKQYTRKEFMNGLNLNEEDFLVLNLEGIYAECPSDIVGLKEFNYRKCECNYIRCYCCWFDSIKDIKFKDEIEENRIKFEDILYFYKDEQNEYNDICLNYCSEEYFKQYILSNDVEKDLNDVNNLICVGDTSQINKDTLEEFIYWLRDIKTYIDNIRYENR